MRQRRTATTGLKVTMNRAPFGGAMTAEYDAPAVALTTEIRFTAVQWVDDDRLVVRHPAGVPLGGIWLDAFTDVRPVEAGKTHLILPKKRGKRRGEDVLAFLLDALAGRAPIPKVKRR